MSNYLAIEIPLFPPGGFRGFGRLGLRDLDSTTAPLVFNQTISSIIGVLTAIAAIWFIFQFISGGLGILFSGGDKAAVASARAKISSGLLGLIVVIGSTFIIDLIGTILGLNILNPAELIFNIIVQNNPSVP